MTTYLVTGGAGFIGSHVVDRLLSLPDARVIVVDNLTTGSLSNLARHKNNLSLKVITENRSLEPDVMRADVVFHLAAAAGVKLISRHPYEAMIDNSDFTTRLLSACFATNTKPHIIFTSSSEVYGPKCLSANEDLVSLGPSSNLRWGYAAEKYFSECQLAAAWNKGAGIPYTAFRLFNIVGTRQSSENNAVLPSFIKAVIARQPIRIHGNGHQIRSLCHVNDLVDAFMKALANPSVSSGKVYNVGMEKPTSILELASMVIDVGITRGFPVINPIYEPFSTVYGLNFDEVKSRCPDTSRLRSELSWSPQNNLRQTIAEIFDHELSSCRE